MRGALVAMVVLVLGCPLDDRGRGGAVYQPSVGDDDDDGVAPGEETDAVEEGEPPAEGGDEGFSCDPEGAQSCPCPDGPGDGVQTCIDGMWGPCLCDGDAGTEGGGDEGSTGAASTDPSGDGGEVGEDGETDSGGEPPPPTEVCYPGESGLYDTCLALHPFDPDAPPDGYDYPEALGGDPNYRKPVAYLDLEAEDPDVALAPNFTLGELAQLSKGRWAIVQPHAVEAMQALRDDLGPLGVNSGYRSPTYNASVGGAGASRHMYGDGFDLDPIDVSLATLENACTAGGGMLVEYETHVHCDWRFDDVDEGFFGPANAAAPAAPSLAAQLHHHGRWLWTSDDGFDEGEPTRRWIAFDDRGVEIGRSRMPVFLAPDDAVRVTVVVGARVERSIVLP